MKDGKKKTVRWLCCISDGCKGKMYWSYKKKLYVCKKCGRTY